MSHVIDMNDVMIERTPHLIAAEINLIKYQTNHIVLTNAIEIGRRLTEAKKLIPYGGWGKWLKESVNYSQSTAEKMMRLDQAYGDKQPLAQSVGEQPQEIPNLSYTQAYILLGVPEEERKAFIAEIDIVGMSTRELQKAVDERTQAEQEKNKALEQKAELRQALDDEKEQNERLTKENTNLSKNAQALYNANIELEKKSSKQQDELNSLKKSTSYDFVDRLRKDFDSASIKAKSNKIAFLYENLGRTIKELKWELEQISADDPDTFVAYKNNVYEFLIQSTRDTLWNKNY
ncbi:DUF3102 domain-containing protein [Dehalobacter sp.]|uniref:DUF3102 domain-containing protein n=1 Tax=Dehalobacter sp. TaxID=1962289 RepID=UPI002586074F|nr:DUF3102 domain-containing protein [Dehalobacter sp.]